jgi:hypothetical protein
MFWRVYGVSDPPQEVTPLIHCHGELQNYSKEQMHKDVNKSATLFSTSQAGMPVISLTTEAKPTDSSNNTDAVKEMARKPISISITVDDAAAKERRQIDEMEFYLLCIDLRTLPALAQFLSCCGGVFFFYLMYGYCQVSDCYN